MIPRGVEIRTRLAVAYARPPAARLLHRAVGCSVELESFET